MIHHLEVSSITALVCAALALLLPRPASALRHLILLLGILRFAAYTPWLNSLGEDLLRFVPQSRPPTPRLLHATLHLLADRPPVPNSATPPPERWIELKRTGWWIWYAIAAFGVGTWLGGFIRPICALRDATFWERDIFLQVAARMGVRSKVDLRIVPASMVPGAQGWLEPRVLLPDGLIHELTEAELEPVLAHEIAHLRRRDPLVAGLVRGIVAVFWFHPLLWWMERRMLAERETACDQMVLAAGSAAQDYVAGIAKICRASAGGTPSYAGVTGANLSTRIEHILAYQPCRRWPRAIAAIPIALAMLAALGPVAGGMLRAQEARAGNTGILAAELRAALTLDAAGRPAEAIPLYLRVLEIDPGSYIALNNVAYLLAERGESLDQSLSYAQRAQRLKPGSPDIEDTLGWVYLKRGSPDRALPFFRDSVLAQPNNFVFRSHLAQDLDAWRDAPEWARELRSLILTSGPATDARVRELLGTIGK